MQKKLMNKTKAMNLKKRANERTKKKHVNNESNINANRGKYQKKRKTQQANVQAKRDQ